MAYRAKTRWKQVMRGGDSRIAQTFSIDPLAARVLINRGLTEDDQIRSFLHGGLDDLEDPLKLDRAAEAAEILHTCVITKKPVRIIGDYDADGVFAVYILYSMLERAGAVVSYDVPDRILDGFGMSMRLVEEAYEDGIDTIITCDNGIAQNPEIARAKSLGMRVIVTDHHEPNYTVDEEGRRICLLPEADVIVDPKIPGSSYPNPHLCGAAVAWKLMHIYESMYMPAEPAGKAGERGAFVRSLSQCPLSMQNLPFAAAATVTDIMPITGENRILVKEGLKLLPKTENAGMRALISCCLPENRPLTYTDAGFILGPCINAAGRLGSARLAVDLLLEKDPGRANALAQQAVALNRRRKQMTEDGKAAALKMIEGSDLINDRVLIVYLEGIHESVAGIVAAKLKENYNRPVIVFTDSGNDELLKGSGRSVEAYNMHGELTRLGDMLERFGGHPMAAGVTIKRSLIDEFRFRINENCSLTDEDLMEEIQIDAAPPLSYLTCSFVESLSDLEPFGPGMRAPLFGLSKARLLGMEVMGANRNCVRLTVSDGSARMRALYFGNADDFIDYLRSKGTEEDIARLRLGRENALRLTLAYRPGINEFRFERSVELKIAHFQ